MNLEHGLKNDGLDITRTPMEDKECAEAYQIGYEAGKRKWESRMRVEKYMYNRRKK